MKKMTGFIFIFLLLSCGTRYEWKRFIVDYEDTLARYSEQLEEGNIEPVLQMRMKEYEDEAVALMEKLEQENPDEAGQFRDELLQLYAEYHLLE